MNHYFNKGFSFIELVTIIAIILILVAIGIPSWRRYAPSLKLSNETERIVEELKLAQQKTVSEQISYIVRFDKVAETYEILRLNPDPANPGEYILESLRVETLDPEVEIKELYDLLDPEIRFTAAGGVVEAGQIELANTRGDTRMLDVRPSGFINY